MTNKEKLQKLKMSLYNRNVDMRIVMAQQDILCEIEKDLKILEILKNIIVVVPNTRDTAGPKYYIEIRKDIILNDETKEIIKRWLENGKNNL